MFPGVQWAPLLLKVRSVEQLGIFLELAVWPNSVAGLERPWLREVYQKPVAFKGRMNATKCRKIFEENLLQCENDLRLGRFTFQHDNSKHTAKSKWDSECP